MVREAKKVRVDSNEDLAKVLNDVLADKEPRVIERNGEEIAAIVAVDDLPPGTLRSPSRKDIERALAAAGAWKGLVPEDFGEKLMERRHASPPSPPVKL